MMANKSSTASRFERILLEDVRGIADHEQIGALYVIRGRKKDDNGLLFLQDIIDPYMCIWNSKLREDPDELPRIPNAKNYQSYVTGMVFAVHDDNIKDMDSVMMLVRLVAGYDHEKYHL
jgi:hypothetical protein